MMISGKERTTVSLLVVIPIVLAYSSTRCSGKNSGQSQEPAVVQPEAVEGDAVPESAVDTPSDPSVAIESEAREQVKRFLADVRIEEYQAAYDGCSWILKKNYSYEQFLMVAGKLQMEELGCIDEDDIDAMIPTSGHVGLGPKDLEVSGFRILYRCEGDEDDRVLVVYLDWGPAHLNASGGVASFFFQ